MLTRHSPVFQVISWNWKHLINRKLQAKKVLWHMILHSYFCNTLYNWNIVKAPYQSIQTRKKLLCCVIVKNYLCNVLCKFLIKMEARGGVISKKRHPTWLYCTVVGLSEAATGGVLEKSCSYKFRNIHRKKPVLGSLFNKVEGLQVCKFF